MKTHILGTAAAVAMILTSLSGQALAGDNWSWGDFWKSAGIDVEGGTVKSPDYETCGNECAGPSDSDLMDDMDFGDKEPKTPPSPEPKDKRGEQ